MSAVAGMACMTATTNATAPSAYAASSNWMRAFQTETAMNEESFNLSMRKFLKTVGVGSQNEIEKAVAKAIAEKSISGTETLPAKMTLEIAGLKLNVSFDGQITLA
jgi:hypothetical protein